MAVKVSRFVTGWWFGIFATFPERLTDLFETGAFHVAQALQNPHVLNNCW